MMKGVDFRTTSLHNNRGVALQAQKARAATRSNFLPTHMQNQASRNAMNTITYGSVKASNIRASGHATPISTFGPKKRFWNDPEKKRRDHIESIIAAEKPKKQIMTFS